MQGVPVKEQSVPDGPVAQRSSVFSARAQLAYAASSPGMRRTLLRQFARAFALASQTYRDGSPFAEMTIPAQVFACAPAVAPMSAAATMETTGV